MKQPASGDVAQVAAAGRVDAVGIDLGLDDAEQVIDVRRCFEKLLVAQCGAVGRTVDEHRPRREAVDELVRVVEDRSGQRITLRRRRVEAAGDGFEGLNPRCQAHWSIGPFVHWSIYAGLTFKAPARTSAPVKSNTCRAETMPSGERTYSPAPSIWIRVPGRTSPKNWPATVPPKCQKIATRSPSTMGSCQVNSMSGNASSQ